MNIAAVSVIFLSSPNLGKHPTHLAFARSTLPGRELLHDGRRRENSNALR